MSSGTNPQLSGAKSYKVYWSFPYGSLPLMAIFISYFFVLMYHEEENYTWLKWVIGLFVAVVLLIVARPFTTVKSTERGVVYKFGAVNSKL